MQRGEAVEIPLDHIREVDEEIKRKTRKDHEMQETDARAILKDRVIQSDVDDLGLEPFLPFAQITAPRKSAAAAPNRAQNLDKAKRRERKHDDGKEDETDAFRKREHSNTPQEFRLCYNQLALNMADRRILWTVTDPRGLSISLTEDVWQDVLFKHPELARYSAQVRRVAQEPDEIYLDPISSSQKTTGAQVYRYIKHGFAAGRFGLHPLVLRHTDIARLGNRSILGDNLSTPRSLRCRNNTWSN